METTTILQQQLNDLHASLPERLFRNENYGGSRVTRIAEVLRFELFELGNEDTLYTLHKTGIIPESILSMYHAITLTEDRYLTEDEDAGESLETAFINLLLDTLQAKTGITLKYALWLAPESSVTGNGMYADGDGTIVNEYNAGVILLSYLGKEEGCLFGYTDMPAKKD